MTEILIVNASPVLADAEAEAVVAALQTWDDTMLRPAWGFDPCTYSFMGRGHLPDPLDPRWPLFLNRYSTDPGALGWHTADPNLIYGRVFVGDCLRYGISWTVDVSHEAAEMRGNPRIDQTFRMTDGRLAMRELCDAVESDDYAIDVAGVKMSNFVLPAYFSHADPGPYDYRGKLHGVCPSLSPGGYMAIYNGTDWTQVTAMLLGAPLSSRALRFSRSDRLPRMASPS
jgi:hypothetical protein